MNTQANMRHGLVAAAALLAMPFVAAAQTPVDDDGNAVSTYMAAPDAMDVVRETGGENIPLLPAAELEELVGPIALYPDDLLAIVLPAAAYPMQIIEAQRFLEDLENDPSLEPNPEWDDSVVALLNYPEVVALLNDDLDWTWRLGEAVVAQQADVVLAIETFRDRAYAAGNLKSDGYQMVSRNDGAIKITPVSDDVIYVPYYEPERVVVYQPRPVYYYYPRAYPVYYYPYPSYYQFDRGFFWGVTTAFTIGWLSDSLHVYHHSYYGHPYYGRSYWDRWWYRRPSISVYNTTYVRNHQVTVNHYYSGDRWQPRHDRRRPVRPTQPRVMNRDHYNHGTGAYRTRAAEPRAPIQFRDRSSSRQRPAETRDPSQAGTDPERVARQLRESRDRSANRREPAARPTRESIARELRASRDRRTGNTPAARAPAERPQSAASQNRARRDEPVTRQYRSLPTQRESSREVRSGNTVRAQQPQRSATPRAARPQPQRATAQRVSQPQPQRSAAQRVSTPQPRHSAPQRVSRPEPQRQARPAPSRESSRATSKGNSSPKPAAKVKRRSDDRRAAR